ncbi:hypothetical protein AB0I10_23050 [Streptomyces sp. NPDC050636]|uniref:hypothetical protein n=1 Tax=Streptomyces sp. NPDC050636 TaxID=3154510 RepID=UPI003423F9B2
MTGTSNDRHSFREINPVQSLRTPSFEFTEVGRQADLAEHDRRLEELARKADSQPVPDRLLDLTPVAGTLTDLSLILDDDGEDLLEDARANAHDGEYGIALELLTEYLQNKPEHQEARYLRAFCMYRLDGQDQVKALRILRPLRDEPMEADLREQVRELHRELRRRLIPLEISAYARTARSDPRGALERAEAFLELAPEEGSLSYLVALGQAKQGALEQALDTATRGAEEADVDKDQVSALARRLLLSYLRSAAEPAVQAFKARNPRLARTELARMAPRWRHNVVIDDFDAYLALCITSRERTSPPAPKLPDDRADDVYSLIAEADGQTATALMQAGLADAAEQVLARVLPLVPGFRWLNFLYAACLLRVGRDPDRAAACAEIARRDPTITQAGQLLEAIRGWQEASVINPAIAEYVAAMKSVNSGVSPDRLDTLHTWLTALQRGLPTVQAAARSEQGRQVVRELEKAIGQRLAEIADAEIVGDLYDTYDTIMSTVTGGVPNVAAADRLARSLDELATRIRDARRNAGKSTGGDPCKKLAELVSARRAELDRVKTGLKVSDLVMRFNDLVQPPRPRTDPLLPQPLAPPPPPDPYTLRTKVAGILQDAQKLRRGSKNTLDPRDLKLLDELIGTISKALG